MLYSLHVKNLALIDELEISFTEGLNILTGETGAGKSLLIGSVNLALGEKSDASLIREGAESALIEMCFGDLDAEATEVLHAMDIEPEADGQLILQRRLYPQRSVCKVSGETVTLKQLRTLASYLVNIHGQNDQQTLRERRSQAEILDAYGAKDIAPQKEKLAAVYGALRKKEKELQESALDEGQRQREMDLIRHEIAEIDEAALSEGEDEALEETFRRLSSAQKITGALSEAQASLDDETAGALTLVSRAVRALQEAARHDTQLTELTKLMADAESVLHDAAAGVADALRQTESDDTDIEEVSARLNLINRLKEKYDARTGGIAAIRAYRDESEERLLRLTDYEAYRERLLSEASALKEEALRHAEKLSALRRKYAKELCGRLSEALMGLNFSDVRLEIPVESSEDRLSADGCDSVSFLISTNPGERLMPLEKVASGGELSRIMLGLQTVTAFSGAHPAMIFDEIDAGISGKTAWSVATKLAEIASGRQVICITHLAQIASMADTHFMIYKDTESGRSITRISGLTEEETERELARLLATDLVSEEALQSARAMRAEALAVKHKENKS